MTSPAGTLNLALIQDAIYDWVNSVTTGILDDIQIVWRDQTEQLPPRPFASLKLIALPATTDRDPNVILGTADQPMTYAMQMEASLSLQVYGNTQITNGPIATQLAIDLHSSLMREDVRNALKQGGVSIQGLGKPQNLSALEESKYEERAGFDIDLGLVQNITDKTGTIGTVKIQGEIDNTELPLETITLP